MTNSPKQAEDPPDTAADTSNVNPTGNTPHGIPKGMEEQDATGHPDSDRAKTETAVARSTDG